MANILETHPISGPELPNFESLMLMAPRHS